MAQTIFLWGKVERQQCSTFYTSAQALCMETLVNETKENSRCTTQSLVLPNYVYRYALLFKVNIEENEKMSEREIFLF